MVRIMRIKRNARNVRVVRDARNIGIKRNARIVRDVRMVRMCLEWEKRKRYRRAKRFYTFLNYVSAILI